ncbi:MAG: N-acetylmuramoyl-L-alanine amidase [Rhizobiaceae bacterium]|nr:N-acetylmuramoyl-L-alanine amidase [Rhizobiaceae bacterium]
MRPINEIIIHCTDTPAGRPVSVAEINRWHLERGWSGIGYHRVVHLDGRREAGRPIERIGAHVAGHNTGTVGVVYVGGRSADMKRTTDTRTLAQEKALTAEIIDLCERFEIGRISGHRDYDSGKACPCFDARAEYGHLVSGMAEVIPYRDEMLRRGDHGAAIAAWANELARYREQIGHQWPVQPTDAFDHTIEMVTIWFQKERGILADGIVGPQTRDEMERALAGKPPFMALAV